MNRAGKAPKQLGDYFRSRRERGRSGLPTLSVTMNDGVILRDEIERRTESSLAPEEHLLVREGDIAYNTMRMWQGACGRASVDGLVSPAYVVLAPLPGINTQFARHWFKSPRMIYLFWAYSHGLTEDRLRLYADDFAQVPAQPPSLKDQQQIAGVLDACDQAIAQTECLIAAKRQRKAGLVRSTLSDEACEWGTVADLAEVNPRNPRVPGESAVSFVAMEDVSEFGQLMRTTDRQRAALESGYTQFAEGDVLTAKITPCFENGKGALARGLTNGVGFGTTEFHVTRPHSRADASYLHQVMLTRNFRNEGELQMTGSAGQKRVPSEFIANFSFAMHDPEVRCKMGRLWDALEADIASETSRLAHLRLRKRGLMQKLLTGGWRPSARPAQEAAA